MGAKVHKSLRIDKELVDRMERLRDNDEPLTHTMNRVMSVGCDTLEGIAQESRLEHASARLKHDATTEKLITMLEEDKKRLITEVDEYKEIVTDKDRQIAAALEKAHELADQSHVLLGMTQKANELPNTEGGDVLDVTPIPEKISFREWWSKYR